AGFTIGHAAPDDAYVVTPLVSNVAGSAPKVDGVLQNAWGVAFSPAASPFWVNDNATGCSTLYDGEGAKVALQVSIPLPGNVIPDSACRPFFPNNPPKTAPAKPT
ncbi:TIGR03118 family protein, partial [Paraburkholderia sp. SIMBA_055]